MCVIWKTHCKMSENISIGSYRVNLDFLLEMSNIIYIYDDNIIVFFLISISVPVANNAGIVVFFDN